MSKALKRRVIKEAKKIKKRHPRMKWGTALSKAWSKVRRGRR